MQLTEQYQKCIISWKKKMFLKNSEENIMGQKSRQCRASPAANEVDNASFDIFSISGKCTNAFLFSSFI